MTFVGGCQVVGATFGARPSQSVGVETFSPFSDRPLT